MATRTAPQTGTNDSPLSKEDRRAQIQARLAERKAARAARGEKRRTATKSREERAAEREAKRKAELQEAIDSGRVILSDDGVEFHVAERKEQSTTDLRVSEAIAYLREFGRETPVTHQELSDTFGGGSTLWSGVVSVLKSNGTVKEYRIKTGNRGSGGSAYLYVG